MKLINIKVRMPAIKLVLYELLLISFFATLFLFDFAKDIRAATCNCSCGTIYCWLCDPPGDVQWCDWDVCDTCDTCGPNPGGDSCINCSSCGGGACFLPDTKIAMPSGEKEIKDIKVGEKVKSFDPETGEIKEATVTDVHKRQVSGYYILKTESGREIKVTGEHPILAVKAKKSNPPAGGLNSKLRGFFEGVWEKIRSLL